MSGDTTKNVSPQAKPEQPALASSKMAQTTLYVKKYCSDYMVYGIQIDQLGLMVSTQKSVLKNMHRVPKYQPKCVKFCWFGFER